MLLKRSDSAIESKSDAAKNAFVLFARKVLATPQCIVLAVNNGHMSTALM